MVVTGLIAISLFFFLIAMIITLVQNAIVKNKIVIVVLTILKFPAYISLNALYLLAAFTNITHIPILPNVILSIFIYVLLLTLMIIYCIKPGSKHKSIITDLVLLLNPIVSFCILWLLGLALS